MSDIVLLEPEISTGEGVGVSVSTGVFPGVGTVVKESVGVKFMSECPVGKAVAILAGAVVGRSLLFAGASIVGEPVILTGDAVRESVVLTGASVGGTTAVVVGVNVGSSVNISGTAVGCSVDRVSVGSIVGILVGMLVGGSVSGISVDSITGTLVGKLVGGPVAGIAVRCIVGVLVGTLVGGGDSKGDNVGRSVIVRTGASVSGSGAGDGVSSSATYLEKGKAESPLQEFP